MTKPWIGIPTRCHAKSQTLGQNRHYLDAVAAAGGLPLLIPSDAPAELLRDYAARVHGMLLPGSASDVDPARYSTAPDPLLRTIVPERDAADFLLLEHAEERDLPVLGICFGVQSMNVFRGGTLLQDIGSKIPQALAHENLDEGGPPAKHAIRIEAGSLLARLAGGQEREVNSYHHQAVERPGRKLRVTATSPDGVIEAVEDPDRRFVVGVQWHPERSWKDDRLSQALFHALVREAEKSK